MSRLSRTSMAELSLESDDSTDCLLWSGGSAFWPRGVDEVALAVRVAVVSVGCERVRSSLGGCTTAGRSRPALRLSPSGWTGFCSCAATTATPAPMTIASTAVSSHGGRRSDRRGGGGGGCGGTRPGDQMPRSLEKSLTPRPCVERGVGSSRMPHLVRGQVKRVHFGSLQPFAVRNETWAAAVCAKPPRHRADASAIASRAR
jgi:hypothetical protein